MLDVFITIDVEIWCNGWVDIDSKFPAALQRYIHGTTPTGDYGVPFQAELLRDHHLKGVFFTEPLFALRFGSAPLQEIVGLIQERGQDVEMHLHTEWVDEARTPILPNRTRKRPLLRHFSLEEQRVLIGTCRRLLAEAGAPDTCAFRAGSFGFNIDTLRALASLSIPFDTSYNAGQYGLDSGVLPGRKVDDVVQCEGVVEYPVSVFSDGLDKYRPVQLTSCTFSEMEGLLWQALEKRRQSFTIVSHSFELLSPSQMCADTVVIERFRRLCAFLDKNRDSFNVRGFRDLMRPAAVPVPAPLISPIWRTGARMVEQIYRRRFR